MFGIREFLRIIYPFLIVKKIHASLIIEFIDIREKRMKRDIKTGRFVKYIPNERELEIYNKIRELNKRGIK